MRTRAAVLFETGKQFEIVELGLDEPKEKETVASRPDCRSSGVTKLPAPEYQDLIEGGNIRGVIVHNRD